MLGQWLTDVVRLNRDNFRIFGPDETASNRLQPVFEVTDKQWNAEFFGPEVDEHLARGTIEGKDAGTFPFSIAQADLVRDSWNGLHRAEQYMRMALGEAL